MSSLEDIAFVPRKDLYAIVALAPDHQTTVLIATLQGKQEAALFAGGKNRSGECHQ
jgi:hypothetical protein